MTVLCLTLALAIPPEQAFEDGLAVERRHLATLGVWSGVNIVGGTVGVLVADDPTWRSFHGTNAAWNTVNLTLAGAGAVASRYRSRKGMPEPEALRSEHQALRTALVINLVADGVYVASGATLFAVGGEVGGIELKGVGAGLAVQGAFLAGFDAHYLLTHRHKTTPMSVTLRPTPRGLTIAGRL